MTARHISVHIEAKTTSPPPLRCYSNSANQQGVMFLLSSLTLLRVMLRSWPVLLLFQTSLKRERKRVESVSFSVLSRHAMLAWLFQQVCLLSLSCSEPLCLFWHYLGHYFHSGDGERKEREKKNFLLVAQGDRLSKTCWLFHSLSSLKSLTPPLCSA